MVFWWVGNILLLLVIAPVVVFLLRGVLNSALSVRRAISDIEDVGGKMVSDLEPVPELVKTESYVTQTTQGLARYGAALDRIL
jgi:hypothetical protein